MAQALSNLPIGAKVKFGKYSVNGEAAQPIIWLVVAKNHSSTPAYPSNAITLLTEKIIDLRPFDAVEPNNSEGSRNKYGNNRYSVSNIDQWLNKDNGGGTWYSAQHNADQAPVSPYVYEGSAYATRPGFLNAFTAEEKGAIETTIIRVAKSTVDGGSYEDISRKVFLASATEVGLSSDTGVAEGGKWSYFNAGTRVAYLTTQAHSNVTSSLKPSAVSYPWRWWLRSPVRSSGYHVYLADETGAGKTNQVNIDSEGIRPALNLSSACMASDTIDTDGCYTVIPNSAPSAPQMVSTPVTVYGGKSNAIAWSVANDPDGDSVTYQLECSLDQGAYGEIYRGTATAYAHLVPFGTTFVSYRVKAIDVFGHSSSYAVSTTKSVVNNNAPVISGTDENLGVKSEGFTDTYIIQDANNNAVTVTEAIDGVQIRALVATLGAPIAYGITGNTWLALPNGSHTLTITATDGIDTTVRTYTFTKLVDSFTIQNSTPWASTTRPSRIMLVVTRNIPAGATFKVEVCNNGRDASPAWEDATAAVTSGLVHVFANTTKSDSDWGVRFRVTVVRNGASGACYVSAIGGNFE